jgi:hypothetical protein
MNEEDTQKFFEDQKKQLQLEKFEKEFKANHYRKKQPDGVFFNEITGKFEKLPEYELIDKEISQMMNDEKSDLKHLRAKNVKEELSKKIIENPEKSTEILRSNIKKVDIKEAMKDLNQEIVKEILSKEKNKKPDLREKIKEKSYRERSHDKTSLYSKERDEKSYKKNEVRDKSLKKNNEKSCETKRGRETSKFEEKEINQYSNRNKDRSDYRNNQKFSVKKNKYELRNRDKSHFNSRDMSSKNDRNFFSRDKSNPRVNNTYLEKFNTTPPHYPKMNRIYNLNHYYSNRSRSPTPDMTLKNTPYVNNPINNYNFLHKQNFPNYVRQNAGLSYLSKENQNMPYYNNYTYEDATNYFPQRKFNIQTFSPINLMSPLPSKLNIDLTSDEEIPYFKNEFNNYQNDLSTISKLISDKRIDKKSDESKDLYYHAKHVLINNLQQITQQIIWKEFCDFNNYVKANFSFKEQNILTEFKTFREVSKSMQQSSLHICLFYYLWLVRSRERIEIQTNKRDFGANLEKDKSFLDYQVDDKFITQNENMFFQNVPTTIEDNSKNNKNKQHSDNTKLLTEDRARSKSKVNINAKRDKSFTPQRNYNNVNKSLTNVNEELKNNFDEKKSVRNISNNKPKQGKNSKSETSLDNSTSPVNKSQNIFLKHKRANDSGELKMNNSKKHKLDEECDNEVNFLLYLY